MHDYVLYYGSIGYDRHEDLMGEQSKTLAKPKALSDHRAQFILVKPASFGHCWLTSLHWQIFWNHHAISQNPYSVSAPGGRQTTNGPLLIQREVDLGAKKVVSRWCTSPLSPVPKLIDPLDTRRNIMHGIHLDAVGQPV